MVHAVEKIISVDGGEWQDAELEMAGFLSSLCSPPSNEATEVWAGKHVIVQDGPFAGSNWNIQFTPFAKFIFEQMRNPHVRRVVLMFSAQYVKTVALLINFLRNAKEDPADCIWVMAEADNITEFKDKRLIPHIEGCDVVAPLVMRSAKNIIQFEGFNMMLRGSTSTAKLRSDPVRDVYCDERADWKKGAIDKLRKRLRAFPNAREISAGTAGDEHGELHVDYEEGSQTRAHIYCSKCGHSQPIRFGREATALWKTARECGGFIWETSEATKPGGKWDYEKVKATVRFECENPSCRNLFTNGEKYELLRTMHPHDYNPDAPAHIKSFGGSAFEAIWESCDWDKLVEEFLKAVEAAKNGNLEPLKSFITETLGEPWQDRLGVIEDFGFLELRKAPYEYGEKSAEIERLFMAADRQEKGGENYWWVIRGFAANGKSRLIAHENCRTRQELEEIRKLYGVAIGDTVIDTGYETQDTYRFCVANGWRAFKGDQVAFYLVPKINPQNPKEVITVRQIWRKTKAIVYNQQTKVSLGAIELFTFSSDSTKDLLMEYMTGLIGQWLIPQGVAKEYLRQMTGERRESKEDGKGVVTYFWRRISDNHYFDCEQMLLIAAIAAKVINAPTVRVRKVI